MGGRAKLKSRDSYHSPFVEGLARRLGRTAHVIRREGEWKVTIMKVELLGLRQWGVAFGSGIRQDLFARYADDVEYLKALECVSNHAQVAAYEFVDRVALCRQRGEQITRFRRENQWDVR